MRKITTSIIFVCMGLFIFLAGSITLWVAMVKIPDFNSFEGRKIMSSTKIFDKTGKILLYDIHKDKKRTMIAYGDMGVNIKNATVAIEDSSFYEHKGIRLKSILRAFISSTFLGKTQGGSTITQQLIKNTLLTSEKTLGRKIKEWILAIKMEQVMSKEKILETYLNESPYGGNIYGIAEASKTFFGKNPIDLTLAESAYLSAMPQAPTHYSPYGKYRADLENRKNIILGRMLELKFISQDDFDKAKKENVIFQPQEPTGIRAPHFVFFIKDYLEQKYGSDMVENGGLKIITTLNWDMQQKAEQIIKEGALINEKEVNGKNAGLVAIDPKTGQILSMVGSRDYFDKEIEGNFNVATASRQPGSSFKPFIYATAFNKGFTDKTVLFDLPTEFQTTCNAYGKALPGRSQKDCYMPDNFDGKFRGPMTLRDALAQSINIIAVKLFYLAGMKDSLNTAVEMGISTLVDISKYGLTLVIGGGNVELLDMTSAYGVLANNGIRNSYTGILKVEDSQGNILEEFSNKPREVLPKNTALMVSDILSDNQARIPTFGAKNYLTIENKKVAVKTGTTNNDRDAWTIGYTPSLVVGVWAGNNDNTPMKKGGSAVAAPLWQKFMTEVLLNNIENENFNDNFESPIFPKYNDLKPALGGLWQGGESFLIDKISGKLATANTPKETLIKKVITNMHSILYWVDKKDIMGPPPTNPNDDSQFSHWEIPIQNWWTQNSYKYSKTTFFDKPTTTDNIHIDENKPIVLIISPKSNDIKNISENLNVQISISGKYPLKRIDYFLNGKFSGSSTGSSFNISLLDAGNIGQNELRAVVYDNVYNSGEATVFFNIKE